MTPCNIYGSAVLYRELHSYCTASICSPVSNFSSTIQATSLHCILKAYQSSTCLIATALSDNCVLDCWLFRCWIILYYFRPGSEYFFTKWKRVACYSFTQYRKQILLLLLILLLLFDTTDTTEYVSKSESNEYWISIFETWYFEHHYILTGTLKTLGLHSVTNRCIAKKRIVHAVYKGHYIYFITVTWISTCRPNFNLRANCDLFIRVCQHAFYIFYWLWIRYMSSKCAY